MKHTNTTAAAVVATTAATNNNAKKTTAKTATAKDAKTTTAATPDAVKISASESVVIAAGLIKEYQTISELSAHYSDLVEKYGKDGAKMIKKDAQEIRRREIADASDNLNAAVFTYNGILSAVFHAVAKCPEYATLCGFVRREYTGTDAERAAAVIRDYYTAVDANGAPLTRADYINAAGTEIFTTYAAKKLTHTAAVVILKTALDNMSKTGANAVTRAIDNAAAVRNNVKSVGAVVAVYAAAQDENGRATRGERRDTSKDAKTAKDAAAVVGKVFDASCYVLLSVWNAAAAGNEDAAGIVDAARNAAKDAAGKMLKK